jgi:hypothetical protein
MDEEVVSKHSRKDGSRILPSLLATLWLFRHLKDRDDPDRPQIVSLNPKSKAALERAKQLAGEGREDARAISELRTLTRDRRRTLRQAEKASRCMGYHRELRSANLTNRLLRAALIRDPIPKPPTTRDDEHIAAIEAFNKLARSAQWMFLVGAQPALGRLETDVRSGRFGEIAMDPDDTPRRGTRTQEIVDGERKVKMTLSSFDPPRTPAQTQRLNQLAHARMQLTRELQSLIGPRSEQHDPVLASQQALDTAERYLRRTS